jgi:hypothetical protein
MNNRNKIIDKLYEKQLDNVDPKYHLNEKDIVRLSTYIGSDPFAEKECCEWKGAISNSSHQSKYINFWFNKKKQALHRILYLNYRGELPKNKYLRFNCKNTKMKGICCNINHLELINRNDADTNYDNDNDNPDINPNPNPNLNPNPNPNLNPNLNPETNPETNPNPDPNTNPNIIEQKINDSLNNQIGKTSKAKKSSKNKKIDTEKYITVKTTNNTHKNDIFIIVFD